MSETVLSGWLVNSALLWFRLPDGWFPPSVEARCGGGEGGRRPLRCQEPADAKRFCGGGPRRPGARRPPRPGRRESGGLAPDEEVQPTQRVVPDCGEAGRAPEGQEGPGATVEGPRAGAGARGFTSVTEGAGPAGLAGHGAGNSGPSRSPHAAGRVCGGAGGREWPGRWRRWRRSGRIWQAARGGPRRRGALLQLRRVTDEQAPGCLTDGSPPPGRGPGGA